MNGFDVACRLHSRSAALLALRLPLLGLLYAFPELGGLLEIGSLVLLTSVVAQSWRNQPGFPKTAIPAEIAVLGLQVCLMIGGIGSGRSDDPAWVPLQAVVFAVALVGLRFETRSRRALSYSAVLLLVFLQVAHTPLARFGCYPGEHLADNGNPLKYCGSLGHPSENATGLIYMRARYYDPLLGRFISQDPAKDGGNWFAYAGNDPVNFADPTGEARNRIWEDGEFYIDMDSAHGNGQPHIHYGDRSGQMGSINEDGTLHDKKNKGRRIKPMTRKMRDGLRAKVGKGFGLNSVIVAFQNDPLDVIATFLDIAGLHGEAARVDRANFMLQGL